MIGAGSRPGGDAIKVAQNVAMERIQIQVTEEQKTALQRKAAASGKSIAGVIRDAVDRYVAADDRESRIERVLTALRRGFRDREGATDVGVKS